MTHKTTHLFKSFLALLVLMLGATSAWADTFEEGYLRYNYTPGESVCSVAGWAKRLEDGHLVIPQTVVYNGTTLTVTAIEDWAFFRKTIPITSVVLPESLVSIGVGAFNGTKLTNITIPGSVKSIGDLVFNSCFDLTSVVLSEGLESIGAGAFGESPALHSLHIPSTVKSIGESAFEYHMLYGRQGLDTITVDPRNPVCYSDNGMAVYCENRLVWVSKHMKSITLPEGLNSIDPYAFMYNNNITEITIPEGVKTLQPHTFWCCGSLKSIILPKGFKRLESSFAVGDYQGDTQLEFIYIPANMEFVGAFTKVLSSDAIMKFEGLPPTLLSTSLLSKAYEENGSGKFLVPKGCKGIYYNVTGKNPNYIDLIVEGEEAEITQEDIADFYNRKTQTFKASLIELESKVGNELFDVNAEKYKALKSSVASIYDAAPTTLEELESRLPALPDRVDFDEYCKTSLLNIFANPLCLRNVSTNEYLGGLSEKNKPTLSNDINATSFWRFEGSGLPQDDNVEGILFNVAAEQYLDAAGYYTSDINYAHTFSITLDTVGNHIGYVFYPRLHAFNGRVGCGEVLDDSLATLWYIETAPTKPKDGRYLFSNFDSPDLWLAPAANKNMVAIPAKATRAVWEVKTVEGGYTLQNVLTGLYAKAGADASHAWTLVDEPQTLQLYLNDGGRAGSVTFGVEGEYNKMHKDNANNIVNWSSDPRTSWVLTPYTIDMAEDLAKAESELLAADLSSYRQIADLLGGGLNTESLTLNDLMREDWNVYQMFVGNYYRFTNVAQGKALGVNASGVPVGTDASDNDMNQLWQLVPAGDGFKLYNPNQGAVDKSKAYLSAMQAGSPAPAASLTSADAARVYHIRIADASAQTFRFAYGMGTHDCINMEGAGYASGNYILDSWGGDNSVFTCALVEEAEVEELREMIAANEAAYTRLTEEIIALQNSLDAAKNTISAECKDVVAQFATQTANIQSSINALSADVKAKYDAVELTADSKIETASVVAAIERLVADAKSAQQTYEVEQQAKIAANEAAYTKLMQEIAELQAKLDAAKETINTECADVAAQFAEQLASIQSAIDALLNDINAQYANCTLTAESTINVADVIESIETTTEAAAEAQKEYEKTVGIDGVGSNGAKVKAIYNLNGKKVSTTKSNQMYIIEYSDGRKVKTIVKK